MFQSVRWMHSASRPVVYEGGSDAGGSDAGGSDAGSDGAAGSSDSGAAAGVAAATKDKSFTQDQVDKIVQKRVSKMKGEVTELQKKLESSQMSQSNRDELETQLNQIQDTLKTEKELAEEAKGKMKRKYDTDLKRLEQERNGWEQRYKRERIEADLIDAATKHDAFAPRQIVKILRDDTSIIEELDDDGKPTGKLATRILFKDVKDNKPVELQLTVNEAVKRMKEKIADYGNLFKSDASSGLGLNNTPGQSSSGGPPLDDQEAYEKWRKKGNKI